MNPQLLRTFLAVAGTGSFSAAAEVLSFTQSAVSQQVALLESDLGTPLFTRRPVTLTPAGERLRKHAQLILTRIDAARADVTRATAPPGRMAAGLTPLAWTASVAEALARLRSSSARLELSVQVTGRDQVLAAVATGRLDVGLVDGFAAPSDPLALPDVGGLNVVRVAESPAVVAVPVRHPLASRAAVDLADLSDAYWIDAPDVVPFAHLPVAQLPVDGLRAGLRYAGTEVTVLAGLVAAGHGLALLPAEFVRTGNAGILGLGVSKPRLVHRVELVHRDGEEPALQL